MSRPLLGALTSLVLVACTNVVLDEVPGAPGDRKNFADGGVCAANFADCNGDPSDGCEVDLQSDGAHCGSCERSCLGEACSAGGCSPVVLIQAVAFGRRLALDATSVYFTSVDGGGTVNKVGLDGGPVSTLASGQDDVYDIAVDPSGIYWTCITGSAVRMLPAGGSLPKDLATDGTPFAIQIQTGTVYFTQIYNKLSDSEHVLHVPGAGGPEDVIAATPSALFLAVDLESAYWTDPTTGALWKAPLAGGKPTALATPLPSSHGSSKGHRRRRLKPADLASAFDLRDECGAATRRRPRRPSKVRGCCSSTRRCRQPGT